MAKTPVSMKIDGYKDREVMMVNYEFKTGKAMKTIKFENGYCVDFEEKWEDKVGHYEEIIITCKNIEVGSVKFENEWA